MASPIFDRFVPSPSWKKEGAGGRTGEEEQEREREREQEQEQEQEQEDQKKLLPVGNHFVAVCSFLCSPFPEGAEAGDGAGEGDGEGDGEGAGAGGREEAVTCMKKCALASSGPANSFSFSFTCTIVLVSVIISIIIFF